MQTTLDDEHKKNIAELKAEKAMVVDMVSIINCIRHVIDLLLVHLVSGGATHQIFRTAEVARSPNGD